MILYERADCPFCWKVRLALAELNIDYTSVACQLGEPHSEVTRLSPTGTVPMLVDGDLVIWDSAVILDYLNARGETASLLPVNAAEQAHVRLLHAYSDKCVGAALRDLVFEKRSSPAAQWDWQLIERSERRWRDCQQWLENHGNLSARHTLLPLSAAECALAARLGIAAAYDSPVKRDYTVLYDWFSMVKQRASWPVSYPDAFINAEE